MKRALVALFVLAACRHAPSTAPSSRAWIEKSNENSQVLLEVTARFAPEQAARIGLTGLDDRISDFTSGHRERQRAALREAVARLEQKKEEDPLVAQDLEILIRTAKRQIRGSELSERLEVPYTNLPRLVFGNIRGLLDPQVAPKRRPAALERARKYADVVQLVEDETRAGLKQPGLLPPSRIEVEEDLRTASFLIEGIGKLFRQFEIAGHQEPVARLEAQLRQYVEFVKAEVLPRAREDFRLPAELYAFRLELFGVDIPPADLAARAHAAFAQIQSEMQAVAQKLGYADYREAIRALKKNQIPDNDVLAHYQKRLAEIEQIIREQRLVTLPGRPARIRLGTPAENAQQPAPHMVPPRLIGNTGEQGEFVLPLGIPGATEQKYDDFNYGAASWTLTAHEARPGHELQFASMV